MSEPSQGDMHRNRRTPTPRIEDLTRSPDDQLVEAARRGDNAAFGELYKRHARLVLRSAARFHVHGHDALDLLQESFLIVLSKLPGLQLRARFTTFLYGVVRNLALRPRGLRCTVLRSSLDDLVDEREEGTEPDELAHALAAFAGGHP